jgi:hypothetical protein
MMLTSSPLATRVHTNHDASRVHSSAITASTLPLAQIAFAGTDNSKSSGSKKKYDPKQFKEPTPKKWLMWMLGPINRAFTLQGPPILRHIPLLNKVPILGNGIAHVREVNFPKADLDRLKVAVNPNTAAFMGPNHPEFFTDWMLDKYVSTQVAPYMASWAAEGFVNGMGKLFQKFWLSNNLIAHTGGKAAKDYSVQWAMKGNGVLLHPEGNVYWTGDKVHYIFPGIVDMAIDANKRNADLQQKIANLDTRILACQGLAKNSLEAREEIPVLEAQKKALVAQGANRPAFVVPLIWKLHFNKDVTRELHGEIAKIEKKLKLPIGSKKDTAIQRFEQLQINLLKRQEEKFGLPEAQRNEEFFPAQLFVRQTQLQDFLLGELEKTYGKKSEVKGDNIRHLAKGIKEATQQEEAKETPDKTNLDTLKQHKKMHSEIERLNGFSAEVYNTPTLTQEHIAESLKRIRQQMLYGGYDDAAKMVPRPISHRTAHIRVPDPINITERLNGRTEISDAERDVILAEVKRRMQDTLDQLNRDIEPAVKPYRAVNPFYSSQLSKGEASHPKADNQKSDSQTVPFKTEMLPKKETPVAVTASPTKPNTAG